MNWEICCDTADGLLGAKRVDVFVNIKPWM